MATNFWPQLKQMWARLKPKQRLVLGGGALVTLIALAAIVKAFSTPEYKPLMVDLEPQDAQAISAQLASKKIPAQVSADGKGISVPEDQLDAARMEVAADGAPHSGRMGFELFDKSSWGQTEFDEKVNYQRALEGELERTIQTLSAVKSARVHLVMPTSSVFLDRKRGAKASVALRMKHGELSSDQVSAIARLVSGAVDDLAPKDVTIIDADSNESLSGHSGTMEGRELEAELSKRLLSTLGPAVGAENLRTSVNVEYDLTSSEENQDKYDPAVSAVLTSQKSSEQVGSSDASGVAGTSANLPSAAPSQPANAADDGSQISSTENATYGVNKTVLRTISPAGRIRRITAAILVNDVQEHKQIKGKWVTVSHKRTAAELQQLTELAQGVLGADKGRGDIVTVQNMAFDDGPSADGSSSTLDQVRTALTEFSTPFRYAAMLLLFGLVWALMFRPMQRQIAASLKELSTAPAAPALDASASAALSSGGPAAALETDGESARLKRELSDLVQAEPASMTRTLQTWLREENS